MAQGRRGTKQEVADKVQLTIYDNDAELWDLMQQVSSKSSKSGVIWEMAKLGAARAAELHEERLRNGTQLAERLATVAGAVAAPEETPASPRQKKAKPVEKAA